MTATDIVSKKSEISCQHQQTCRNDNDDCDGDVAVTTTWLKNNQKRMSQLWKEHLQWVSDRTNHFEDAALHIPPTMKIIKEQLTQGRLHKNKNARNSRGETNDEQVQNTTTGSSSTTTPSTIDIMRRKPTILPVKNPLRVEELNMMLTKSTTYDEEKDNSLSSSEVLRLCEAVQGYHPGALKAPLENWLFDSFLCSAEQIIPNLWLGGFVTAHNKDKIIDQMHISHVLCVGGRALSFGEEHYHPPFADRLTYKIIDVDDTEKASDADTLGDCFPDAVKFIEHSLVDQKAPILVHCMAGASRSASVVCAYLIWKYELDVNSALQLVRSARPIATPNSAFEEQLERWYKQIKEERR